MPYESKTNALSQEIKKSEETIVPENIHTFSKIEKVHITTLNDTFRQTGIGGKILMTRGITESWDAMAINDLIREIRTFNAFTKDNDPYGEHDFGIIKFHGESVYWKIDYFDKNTEYHSPDKSDPSVTTRVMTIYLASEH